jgi:hypothetical protein
MLGFAARGEVFGALVFPAACRRGGSNDWGLLVPVQIQASKLGVVDGLGGSGFNRSLYLVLPARIEPVLIGPFSRD